MLNFFDKVQFNSFFSERLGLYATYIEMQKISGECNFLQMEDAKKEFMLDVFKYCERMLKNAASVSKRSSSEDMQDSAIPRSIEQSSPLSDSNT